MGQELVRRAPEPPTRLWATQVMINHPGMVRDIHADYFAAGAEIATANTYCIHRDRLVRWGDEARFEELLDMALDEVWAAREAHGSGRIAGSIGPLFGSYRPEDHPALDEATPLYAEVAGRIAPRCDLLLLETVASLTHAEAALRGTADTDLPVWLAVTVDDEDGSRLRSGEPVSDLAALVRDFDPQAVLANCSAPEAMASALEAMAEFGRPYGAYANGFKEITKKYVQETQTVDSLESRPDLTAVLYADFVDGWIAAGATIVGGCCETGPAHIAEIGRRLGKIQ
jgi:homocysteine S-methyltransferase